MNWQGALPLEPHFVNAETPRFAGRAVVVLASDPNGNRWSGHPLSGGGLAHAYGFNDLDGLASAVWRHIANVQKAEKPANADYR